MAAVRTPSRLQELCDRRCSASSVMLRAIRQTTSCSVNRPEQLCVPVRCLLSSPFSHFLIPATCSLCLLKINVPVYNSSMPCVLRRSRQRLGMSQSRRCAPCMHVVPLNSTRHCVLKLLLNLAYYIPGTTQQDITAPGMSFRADSLLKGAHIVS